MWKGIILWDTCRSFGRYSSWNLIFAFFFVVCFCVCKKVKVWHTDTTVGWWQTVRSKHKEDISHIAFLFSAIKGTLIISQPANVNVSLNSRNGVTLNNGTQLSSISQQWQLHIDNLSIEFTFSITNNVSLYSFTYVLF